MFKWYNYTLEIIIIYIATIEYIIRTMSHSRSLVAILVAMYVHTHTYTHVHAHAHTHNRSSTHTTHVLYTTSHTHTHKYTWVKMFSNVFAATYYARGESGHTKHRYSRISMHQVSCVRACVNVCVFISVLVHMYNTGFMNILNLLRNGAIQW